MQMHTTKMQRNAKNLLYRLPHELGCWKKSIFQIFLKHGICRKTSKQFTAIPHVVKLDECGERKCDLTFLCLRQSGLKCISLARSGFPHCWLNLARNRASLPHEVFQFVLIFVSYWPIFVTCFAPIQNMCSPLFSFILILATKVLGSKR